MLNKLEFRGEWWIPERPETRIHGTLTFNQDKGAVLELDGRLADNPEKPEPIKPRIIHGISSDGVNITLLQCIEKHFNIKYFDEGTRPTSKLYAHALFTGAHFKQEDDIRFRYLVVGYSNLDTWLNISGFEINPERKKGEDIVNIRYTKPDSIEVLLNNNELAFSIVFGFRYSPFALNADDLKQSVSVKFSPISPIEDTHIKKYEKLLHHFQNFLSLAMLEPAYPTSIVGLSTLEQNKLIIRDEAYYPRAEVFYQLVGNPQRDTTTNYADYLFNFKTIQDKFQEYLKNWYAKQELLKPVHQLYFATLYSPAMYLDQRFLCYVQAIESYHRRTTSNLELPEEAHKKRIQQIISSVPQEYENWLFGKLNYSNEPSLRGRLRDIMDTHKTLVSEFVQNTQKFINDVTITRNYLIHYDPALENKAAKGKGLFTLTQKLKILVEACLLHEIGFSHTGIRDFLSRHYQGYGFYAASAE